MPGINTTTLNFLHVIEQLKHELRHSWTSKGRQESVAEHSWRLCAMLIICAPHLEKKIDLLKALKLAVFHDIGEVKVGDEHYLNVTTTEKVRRERSYLEAQAVYELSALLEDGEVLLFELWKEFETKNSYEAKIVYFLDKLEVCIQHNEADISTWTDREIDTIKNYYDDLAIKDPFLSALKYAVQEESFAKIEKVKKRSDTANI
ncbi:MAG: hypothetical protein K1000chlam3_00242 [Chlamydiae bacterium]|nr:hypothetical protein [Chlamydiota bacterium]